MPKLLLLSTARTYGVANPGMIRYDPWLIRSMDLPLNDHQRRPQRIEPQLADDAALLAAFRGGAPHGSGRPSSSSTGRCALNVPRELQCVACGGRALRRGAWGAWLLGAQLTHGARPATPSQFAENCKLRIRSNLFLTTRVYLQVDGPPSPAAGRARPSAGGTSPVPLEMNDETMGGDDGKTTRSL